jgi:hypothetical protein
MKIMRNKTIITLLIILVCSAASAQAARIWVEPAQQEVSEGANFTVDIMVDPEGAEVIAAEYKLHFNTTLLNATDQTSGTFLSHDGVSTMELVNKINNTLGKVEYGEFRTGVDYGVTNLGVLASVTFDVIGERGICDLVLDDVVLSDPNAAEIPANVTGGSVEILSGICGDVTGNDVVDTGDVILLSNYVGYSGYVLQNEWAGDVTGNGVIDTGDVILLSNFVGYSGYSLNCTG